MTTNAIIIFIVFNVLNVVIQTIKSIATIKCGKNMAAIINAIAYGLYTYIVVLTASDGVSLWFKIVVVALANLVGVWVVKFVEEKGRKDKLWKVEATVPREVALDLVRKLKTNDLPYNYVDINKYFLFNVYCATQAQSAKVKEVLNAYNAKYFVSESKTL